MNRIDKDKIMILSLLYATTYMGTQSFEEVNVPELEIEASMWSGLLVCEDFIELLNTGEIEELFEDQNCNTFLTVVIKFADFKEYFELLPSRHDGFSDLSALIMKRLSDWGKAKGDLYVNIDFYVKQSVDENIHITNK